jgi:hypothetical protein
VDWKGLTVDYDLGNEFTWKNSVNQQGFFTNGAYNTSGQAQSTNLALEDLQNALYLVLEVTEYPTGGGSIVWQNNEHTAWGGNAIFASDGKPVGNGTASTKGNGVEFNSTFADGKNLIVLRLNRVLNDYSQFLAIDPDTGWVRIYIQYYGANSANMETLGLVNAYLLFNDGYVPVGVEDEEDED